MDLVASVQHCGLVRWTRGIVSRLCEGIEGQVSEKDGGPAFPRATTSVDPGAGGMSLRDYFAATALPSAIAEEIALRATTIRPGPFRYEAIAQAAYVIADAMLKERAK